MYRLFLKQLMENALVEEFSLHLKENALKYFLLGATAKSVCKVTKDFPLRQL